MKSHEQAILTRLSTLGIEALRDVHALHVLDGGYINLLCRLPNGQAQRILDDSRTYLGCQVEQQGSDRCYGVAADETQIAVYTYGCDGADARLELWAAL